MYDGYVWKNEIKSIWQIFQISARLVIFIDQGYFLRLKPKTPFIIAKTSTIFNYLEAMIFTIWLNRKKQDPDTMVNYTWTEKGTT